MTLQIVWIFSQDLKMYTNMYNMVSNFISYWFSIYYKDVNSIIIIKMLILVSFLPFWI